MIPPWKTFYGHKTLKQTEGDQKGFKIILKQLINILEKTDNESTIYAALFLIP